MKNFLLNNWREIVKVLEAGGIYAIENIKTLGIYIGSTSDFARRLSEHVRNVLRGN